MIDNDEYYGITYDRVNEFFHREREYRATLRVGVRPGRINRDEAIALAILSDTVRGPCFYFTGKWCILVGMEFTVNVSDITALCIEYRYFLEEPPKEKPAADAAYAWACLAGIP